MENYEKKYKEVLEKAKALYKASEPMSGCNVILEILFPELKESEDEKVRKELIKHLKELSDWKEDEVIPVKNPSYYRQWASWLERQGEKKPEMKTAEESLGVDSKTYNKIVDECIFDEQNDSCVKDYNNIDPHFGKSIDKTESKFKVGDWITNGDYTWKIVEVKPLDYILQSQDGNVVDDTISHVDEQFHSFTIEDAKDGDVLICKGNIKNSNGIKYERICLFNNLNNAFFTLTKTSNFVEEYDIDVNIDYPDNTVPATKEQKEILFMAMKEAGYIWDAEKKELKKISQRMISAEAKEAMYAKPAWSEEDEELLKWSINNLTELKDRFGEEYGKVGKCIDWVKSLKDRVQPQPKQEWSEEEIEKAAQEWDSKANFNPFYMTMENGKPTGVKQSITTHKESFKAGVNWILKYGVQPKQEWSEEDENRFNNLIFLVECSDENEPTKKGFINFINRLKSLRPQNNITDEELTQAKKNAYNDALDKIEYHSGEPTFDDGWSAAIDYIQKKSIRPQNHWKPSDGDIIILEKVIKGELEPKIFQATLQGILEQLKKL